MIPVGFINDVSTKAELRITNYELRLNTIAVKYQHDSPLQIYLTVPRFPSSPIYQFTDSPIPQFPNFPYFFGATESNNGLKGTFSNGDLNSGAPGL